MEKNYAEELAVWVEKRALKKRRQDAATVEFLSVKTQVVDAMEAGFALTTIWEHMHETGKVKCGYETFRKHVRRYIRKPSASTTPTSTPVGSVAPDGETTPAQKGKRGTSAPQEPKRKEHAKGFTYDPTPNKEELI